MSFSLFSAVILASAVQGGISEDGKCWAAKGTLFIFVVKRGPNNL